MAPALKTTLKSLLSGSTGENIQACLIKSLTKATPEELKGLSTLLAPLSVQAGDKKHCVRCHVEYSDNENHQKACKIEHNKEGDYEQTNIGSDEMTMTMTLYCCGIEFDSDDSPPTRFCIVEAHTTDLGEVMYYDDATEDGDNENVISCAKAGCSKKRKPAKEASASRVSKKRT
ncbi:hypothetical protein GALMADRAFT_249809 [Galerina marginata CBS 339.88]|uniref:Uncharacterized protein n=1 Tax=Galerina marginata (strain CBS 339.88) TaxID=685588 RepID=A0A067SVE1_GALM3|nr:hypothetical protein GALMADRAFT_249809 [Galerina marginata CBS 339.88]